MNDFNIIAKGLGFPEGPVSFVDGSIILTEINGGKITKVAPDGALSQLGLSSGGPNGLAAGPDGDLYLCDNGGIFYRPGYFLGAGPAADYAGGSIQRIDKKSGERTLLFTECDGHLLSAPNDIVFDREGGFYFTDMGKRYARSRDHGGLYYAQSDGSRITEVAYPILSANGVGLSPDERTVYVADTEGARLWSFEIQSPGVLKKGPSQRPHGGRCIGGLPGQARFDSLAVTRAGNIAVATVDVGLITVFAPNGDVLRQVGVPDSYPTNICFGGPEMTTAYITLAEKGELISMPWDEPGLVLNFSTA